jgi:hypothetical protein
MARPPLVNRSVVKSARVLVRVRRDELAQWKAKAVRLGVSVSAWLRMLADRDARM